MNDIQICNSSTNPKIDIVTVFHCEYNYKETQVLHAALDKYEDPGMFSFITVDNRVTNRGFARACNLGVSQGSAEFIGLINPDAIVLAPLFGAIYQALSEETTVIAGERFDKPFSDLWLWGVQSWVCGALFFVKRSFWEMVGGFDEQFEFGYEETDMIRQAEQLGLKIKELKLPVLHSSPLNDSTADIAYKHRHLQAGWLLYSQKWGLG